ncbi:MAG: hypothetical protein ACI9W6_001549 [Motiliproteus sp.]|jgi:hypothetical protein
MDFQLVDVNGLRLLDIDNLGISFKREVPKCLRVAIVRVPGIGDLRYAHLTNLYNIDGVETALF